MQLVLDTPPWPVVWRCCWGILIRVKLVPATYGIFSWFSVYARFCWLLSSISGLFSLHRSTETRGKARKRPNNVNPEIYSLFSQLESLMCSFWSSRLFGAFIFWRNCHDLADWCWIHRALIPVVRFPRFCGLLELTLTVKTRFEGFPTVSHVTIMSAGSMGLKPYDLRTIGPFLLPAKRPISRRAVFSSWVKIPG